MGSKRIAVIAALLGCFGLIDSGYLTIKHLQGAYVQCGDECSAVLGSQYADGVAGIPLAGFGVMAYSAVIVAALLMATGVAKARRLLGLLAATMAIFSVWLVYLQAFVIHSFCRYCLASAGASFTLAGLMVLDRLFSRADIGQKA